VSYIASNQYGLSLKDADTLIQENSSNPDFVLLDVRTPAEFSDISIEGAINMDFYCPSFHNTFNQLDKTHS
ncbi:MAG: rhodanese-like domain-containing protein, partial [bacterium]|nr:rhodanese-like domain-containing protein [bacterium]